MPLTKLTTVYLVDCQKSVVIVNPMEKVREYTRDLLPKHNRNCSWTNPCTSFAKKHNMLSSTKEQMQSFKSFWNRSQRLWKFLQRFKLKHRSTAKIKISIGSINGINLIIQWNQRNLQQVRVLAKFLEFLSLNTSRCCSWAQFTVQGWCINRPHCWKEHFQP